MLSIDMQFMLDEEKQCDISEDMHFSDVACCRTTGNLQAKTSSSAIAERPRCRVDQLWPKVEDDILQRV